MHPHQVSIAPGIATSSMVRPPPRLTPPAPAATLVPPFSAAPVPPFRCLGRCRCGCLCSWNIDGTSSVLSRTAFPTSVYRSPNGWQWWDCQGRQTFEKVERNMFFTARKGLVGRRGRGLLRGWSHITLAKKKRTRKCCCASMP